MCRIFYALNQPQLKHKIEQFLMQSDHPPPKYVEFSQKEDLGTRLSGYGLASFQEGKWKIFKTPRTYKTEPRTAEFIKETAKSPLVIGHIRDKVDEAIVSLENTHPFQHEEHIFIQNGRIYDFQECKPAIVKKILPKYVEHISGETDTEYIFYLLLSCIERKRGNTQDAFQTWFRILSRVSNKYTANIVYANATHSVITRKSHINRKKYPGETIPVLSLFWNGPLERDCQILITSEPIMRTYYPIQEGAIVIIPHAEYM